jgi:hypothetical protein
MILGPENDPSPADPKKVSLAGKKVKEFMDSASFTTLEKARQREEESREMILRAFNSEPIDELFQEMLLDGIRLNYREAMQIDLTQYAKLDMFYRWHSDGDIAINFRGKPNKGKSNNEIWFALEWCRITGAPFRLDNITQYSVLYNLMLKGFKVKDTAKGIEVRPYTFIKGDFIGYDEGSDAKVAGQLSATTISENADIENRMRVKQIARFTAGVRELQHAAYYNVLCTERNQNTKVCTGFVYNNMGDSPENFIIGSLRIPYVPLNIFEAYKKPKVASVDGYATGADANILSRLLMKMGDDLKEDKEYQSIPEKPSIQRILWLRANPKYSIFQTTDYFKTLEQISRIPPSERDQGNPSRTDTKLGTIGQAKRAQY